MDLTCRDCTHRRMACPTHTRAELDRAAELAARITADARARGLARARAVLEATRR